MSVLHVLSRHLCQVATGLICFGLVWLYAPASAQPAPVQQNSQQRAASPPVVLTPEQRAENLRLAQELLALTQLPTFLERRMRSELLKEMRKTPEFRGYTDIFRDFLQEHISASLISEEMGRYLVANFTERELLQLKAIVNTDVGRKMFSAIENLPETGRFSDANYQMIFDQREKKQLESFSRLPVFRRFSDSIPIMFDFTAAVISKRIEDNLPALLPELIRRKKEQERQSPQTPQD